MGVKIIWTCGLLMLFLKGSFNGTVRDNHVELLDKVEVWRGSCAMLPCKYKPKEPFDKFIWYYNATYDIINREFNGTTVYNSKDGNDADPLFAGRVQYVGKSDTDCTIVIRNIQKEDEGTYNLRLLSKNKDFKWMSKTLTMAVSDIGTTLKIDPLPEIREWENVTLTCSISYYCPFNNISLYWIEDVNGTSTIDIRSDTSEVRTTSTLMFRPSWRDNEKNITCVLNGDDGESDNTTVQLNVTYAPDKPDIKKYGEPVEGKDITLECSTKANPPVSLYVWFKDGDERYNHTSNQFTIYNIKEDHSGSYTCLARNKLGEATSYNLDLNVMYAPRYPKVVLELDRPTFTEEDKMVFVEGDKVTIQCNVTSSNPEVTNIIWYKNGKSIPKNFSQPVKAEDAGNYTCEAENSVGRTMSPEVMVDIHYAPDKPDIKKYVEPVEGKDITLECSTKANPPVSRYVWFKDGDERYNHTSNQFTIYNIKEDHSGSYTCLARNKLGEATSYNLDLNVMYAPRYPKVLLELDRPTFTEEDKIVFVEEKIIFVEGDNVTIRCNVTSSNPEVTNIMWYKNGKSIQKFFTQPVKAEDAGNYTCEAENSVGRTMSPEVMVDIHYPPKGVDLVLGVSSKSFKENEMVSLRCLPNTSKPESSRYEWYKDGVLLRNSTDDIMVLKLEWTHTGQYSCTALNAIGAGESPKRRIDVQYAPRCPMVVLELNRTFSEEDKIIFVEGDKVLFRCNVTSSNPEVTDIIWYKNGNKIKKCSESLKAEDAGNYTCEAENSVGRTMSPKVMVDIHYAPKNVTLIVIPGDHVIEHMDVTLKCSSKVKSTPINYEFYLNNVSLSADNGSFELKNIRIKDTGEYSCLASNFVGERRSNVVFLHVSNSPATIGKFASLGAFSFISLLMLIILIVRFRVRIRNALCRRTVDDKSESSFFVLKKYENIASSERAHEDSRDGTSDSVSANLNEKDKERERAPEVEYASLGHS